jgi:hypothetical protein
MKPFFSSKRLNDQWCGLEDRTKEWRILGKKLSQLIFKLSRINNIKLSSQKLPKWYKNKDYYLISLNREH